MAKTNGLREPLPQPALFPFGPGGIDELFDAGLRDHPGRVALIDGDRTWTWEQLHDAVASAAAPLPIGEIQLAPQGNSAELIIAALAIMYADGIWATNAGEKSPDVNALHDEFLVEPGQQLPTTRFNLPAAIAYTSGTTGSPKAVVHSQQGLLLPGLVSVEVEPPTDGERIGTPLDLTIANVFVLGPLSALLRGSTFVVMKKPYVTGLAEDIAAHGITRLFAVPTMAHDLAALAAVDPTVVAQLSSLDRVILGGSGAEPEMITNFTERFGVRPTLSYGLSEAPTGVARESLDDPIGSRRGFPLPHVEVIVVDPESGGERPIGSVGEVCILPARSGPWAGVWTGALGYLFEPDRTDAAFRGELLHTGDTGTIDRDGAVSIMGRLGNLIVRGAKNIDPVAIEAHAKSLAGVADAAAVGVPDDRLGEIVGLAVVVDGEWDSLDLAEAALTVEERTSASIDAVVIVDELPRNAMGKVDRAALRARFTPDTHLP